MAAAPPVSPPTRGWTLPEPRRFRYSVGFPAHAGMDLNTGQIQINGSRFPRPRGDGPTSVEYQARRKVVSPPTRGWTPDRARALRRWIGFPAHAGMDPSPTTASAPFARFPRPRGDGPQRAEKEGSNERVSPPTRGWTEAAGRDAHAAEGFPAHAGMDPNGASVRRDRLRFPRPRGDGPVEIASYTFPYQVSPPTRGWTRRVAWANDDGRGFPAHAGMDLSFDTCLASSGRFPRPRGDGPEGEYEGSSEMEVSPPTRGWTSYRVIASCSFRGFPAHAGMDLS